MPAQLHGQEPTSAWVARWSHLLSRGCTVLDLACGHGRHMRHFAALGHPVMGVDRNPQAIAAVAHLGEAVCADIENGPWPLLGRRFGGMVVTHYLWRPLWPCILDSLAPDGVLMYETFSAGNESVGKPSRPDFLLRHAELLSVCQHLRIVAFEEGFLEQPERFVQRIVAVREPSEARTAVRYRLSD
ncbi:class I SAM-dependent methyltransferase [Limnohabitans sp.]|uniref:class I SAM-dependent methyltransferase n=1 Tax=Limnohabitans sp. TaxID=1907725 RepID=UPI00286EC05E|nr:class I SAM-dependent methyltransferase [Limnohabitans sp.]